MEIQSLIQLTSSDLIQANATIIAGVLVLLTISIISQKKVTSNFWGDPLAYIAFLPIPSVISIVFLVEASYPDKEIDFFFYWGKQFFSFGVVCIMIFIPIIAWIMVKNKNES